MALAGQITGEQLKVAALQESLAAEKTRNTALQRDLNSKNAQIEDLLDTIDGLRDVPGKILKDALKQCDGATNKATSPAAKKALQARRAKKQKTEPATPKREQQWQ